MQAIQENTNQPKNIHVYGQLDIDDINRLDFSMIKLKLQDADEGPGWTAERCEEVQESYGQFLALKRAYPERDIVPNRDVDTFWHYHILDTAKYADDCEDIFGYFLHHYPYFGMNGAEDYANLCVAFDDTAALYAQHFSGSWGESAKNRARCRTQCKPQKCR